jgi:signal transduction histidine kinase
MPSPTDAWWRLTERTRITLSPLSLDIVIVVMCWVLMVLQVAIDTRADWLTMPLAALNALPLLWRRRFPFTVAAVTGASTTWLSLTDRLGDLPPAQLVATYTIAALCPPLTQLIAAAVTITGISVSILIPKEEFLNLGKVGIAFAVAYALGAATRAHRDRIAILEERAHGLVQEQHAAAARERQRIAREMHDILAHSMSLIAVQAEAGPVAVRSDPDKAEEVFDSIAGTARDSLAQLRRVLGVLRADEVPRRPQPGLDDLAALLADTRRTGLTVDLEEFGSRRTLAPDVATAVYRIVQEALTNTVKHAGAGRTLVRLDWRYAALRIEVTDDGRGRARGRADRTGGGHGLTGMRERVAAAGGSLEAGPGPDGTGFRVRAVLP